MTGPRGAASTSAGRIYTWQPTGEKFPSATTVIGVLDKPALKSWAAKMVAEYAFDQREAWTNLPRTAAVDMLKREPLRTTNNAAEVGTAVHKAAEMYSRDVRGLEFSETVAPFMQQFAAFLRAYRPVFVEIECTVYSRSEGYAGTLDFIADINGRRLLCDIKTGASGIFSEVALQLAAYRHADFIGRADDTETPMPRVDGAAALHLRPDKFDLIEVEAGEREFVAFLSLLEVWRWKDEASRTVIGGSVARAA